MKCLSMLTVKFHANAWTQVAVAKRLTSSTYFATRMTMLASI
jgi:hypothetical protein